jgi:hypothetical protein
MLHLVAPSSSVVSSASRNAQPVDANSVDLDVELTTRSRNLSSTLHKLYLWEKKLYQEVKVCYVMPVTKLDHQSDSILVLFVSLPIILF